MDMYRIEECIADEIKEKLIEHSHNVKSCLKDTFRRIFWSEILGHSSKRIEFKIDTLIDTILDTVFLDGPEGETWPSFDRKKVEKIIAELKAIVDRGCKKKYKVV